MGSTAINKIKIKLLQAAIEQRFGSTPVYVEAVPVHEPFEGQPVWDGVVHVFDVEGGQRCYAWAYVDEASGKLQIMTVLHEPPVDSPVAAVRASIIEDYRQHGGHRG